MELEHKVEKDVLIFTPKFNSLDVRNSLNFKEEIQGILEKEKITHAVVNLGNILFIDSSGLGCLISVLRNLKAKGGILGLTGVNKPIRTIFELVSMDKIFPVFNTVSEAVSSLTPKIDAKREKNK